MSFASAILVILLTLVGAGIVYAAFQARRVIAWEDRVLTSLADSVREARLVLEEEALLLERAEEAPKLQAPERKSSRLRQSSRAA